MWFVDPDKTVQYAGELYKNKTFEDGRSQRFLCSTKPVWNRGNTLNPCTLNIDAEAEFDGVISLEVSHFTGKLRRLLRFDLYPDGRLESSSFVERFEKASTLTSGGVSSTVSSEPHTFSIKCYASNESKGLTSLLNRTVGLAYSPSFTSLMS